MAQRAASGSAGSLSSCVIGSYLHTRRYRLGFRPWGGAVGTSTRPRPRIARSLTDGAATTVVCALAEGAHPARPISPETLTRANVRSTSNPIKAVVK
jgi:hypothetical protein